MEPVGELSDAREAGLEAEDGQRRQDEQTGGEHGRDERAPCDRADDPRPDAALGPRALLHAPPQPGHAKGIDTVAQEREHGRQERERRNDGDHADEDRAGREAAEDRVGDEHHPHHREDEGGAAEQHGAARRRADGRDRVELLVPVAPLFAEARDDEERVVDPEREAHPRDHVHDEDREIERLADERREPEGDHDRDERDEHGHQPGHDRAEHEQQDDQRRRQPELELSLPEVLLRERGEVPVGRELTGDRRLEPVARGRVDDLDHVPDARVAVALEAYRDHRRVPAGRQEGRVLRGVVGADGLCDPGLLDRAPKRIDLRAEGSVVDGQGAGADDDELVDVVAGRREVLRDQVVAAVRLRVVRHLRVRRQRRAEQADDGCQRGEARAPQAARARPGWRLDAERAAP